MKTINLILTLLCAGGLQAAAQEHIQFGVGEVKATSEISDEAKNVLKSKLSQILNRNSAASGGSYGVFEVSSTIDVGDTKSTAGLVKNVVELEGSVTLTAKNTWDNAEYYSVTVPLNTVQSGDIKDPGLLLARSVKVTDPAYVRFIKKARENISRALDQDCELTVERAQTFITAGYEQHALAILLALPPGNSCSDLSHELVAAIRAQQDAKVQKEEDKEKELRDEKMRLAEMKIKNNQDDDTDIDLDSTVEDFISDQKPEIYCSDPGWKLQVLSCQWVPENRRVTVELKVETKNSNTSSYYFEVQNAIADNGDSYGWNSFATSSSNVTVPENVPVKCRFDIKCSENPKKFSFVKLRIGPATFEIKNLKVASK